MFGEAVTPADQVRGSERDLKRNIARTTREADNYKQDVIKAQARLLAATRTGNERGRVTAAKELARARKHEAQTARTAEQLANTRDGIASTGASVREMQAVANATDVMTDINSQMPANPMSLAANYSRQRAMNAMQVSAVRDALNDAEDEDEEDEEQGAEIHSLLQEADLQVLDERQEKARARPVGGQKVASMPMVEPPDMDDAALEKRLKGLSS